MMTKRLPALFILAAGLTMQGLYAQQPAPENHDLPKKPNLATVATVSGSARFGGPLTGLNDNLVTTSNRGGMRQRADAPARPRTQLYINYEWKQPVATREIATFWWNFNNGIRLPEAYHLEYWDGNTFVPVKNVSGLTMNNKALNTATFDEVKTTKMRILLDSADFGAATLQEWMVFKSDNSPSHPPLVDAGVDRDVMLGGKTYLAGTVKSVMPVKTISWTKASGPGNVDFAENGTRNATAIFSAPGSYELKL
ncbi:MAG: hypothetical protein EOO01_17815, partial [Chitinophagaceae bacterium]